MEIMSSFTAAIIHNSCPLLLLPFSQTPIKLPSNRKQEKGKGMKTKQLLAMLLTQLYLLTLYSSVCSFSFFFCFKFIFMYQFRSVFCNNSNKNDECLIEHFGLKISKFWNFILFYFFVRTELKIVLTKLFDQVE